MDGRNRNPGRLDRGGDEAPCVRNSAAMRCDDRIAWHTTQLLRLGAGHG